MSSLWKRLVVRNHAKRVRLSEKQSVWSLKVFNATEFLLVLAFKLFQTLLGTSFRAFADSMDKGQKPKQDQGYNNNYGGSYYQNSNNSSNSYRGTSQRGGFPGFE